VGLPPRVERLNETPPEASGARAVSDFYVRWRPYVLARARRYARSIEDAEDLAAETFLVCLRRSEILALPDEELRGLLGAAVRNRAIDLLRRRRASQVPAQELEDRRVPQPLDVLVDRETRTAARAQGRALFAHLDELRRRLRRTQRTALDAYLFGEDDYAAAARRAGLTTSQLTQRIHSAVRRLYSHLDPVWRRNLAPLRRLQPANAFGREAVERVNLRLIELLARQARKQVKRDAERFVRERVQRYPPRVRGVFELWVQRGCSVSELPSGERRMAERLADELARELRSRESRLASLLLSTAGRWGACRRRAIGRGPGAETPLQRWCLRDLRPRLRIRSPRGPQRARTPRRAATQTPRSLTAR